MEQKEQLKEILPCYMLMVQLFKERLGCNLDQVITRKFGLGVVNGESPRLGVSALLPRLVHSRLGIGAGRLGVARHDAAPLSCYLATPRRCHGRLGVGAEVLPYARA
ncbi:hypothetical protein PIB30_085920 [Stylosanthes scabra]|uniref:Uncharacterized protein n=1 Tax=Stylosanthes scabra TaxID=79078 RepID=A0ABU6TSG2_9FABA|nr:hypothetical protein [Stylosanthes scabra]